MKLIKLGDEVDNSIKQIIYALKELQTTVRETAYYFITFQLLSNGLERLLKCSICFGYLHKKNRFPTLKEIKTHNISLLLKIFLSDYFSDNGPLLKDDLLFLSTNQEVVELVELLSGFGDIARYHNLNVVTGDLKAINIQETWQRMETKFISADPDFHKLLILEPNYEMIEERVTRHFVMLFERITRAIVRQYTLGDLGDEPKRFIGFYSFFLQLSDENIGKTDYDERFFTKSIKNPANYTSTNNNRRRILTKTDYTGPWPFINTDTVIIEKSNDGYIFLIINGKIYALNGITSQKYNLPFAHDSGEAYKGRSVGEFITMALEL